MKKLLIALLLFSACGKEVEKEVKVIDKFKTEAYTRIYTTYQLFGKNRIPVIRTQYVPKKYYLKVEWIEVKTKEIEIDSGDFESTKLGDTKVIKVKE